jgi:hypothetical protein
MHMMRNGQVHEKGTHVGGVVVDGSVHMETMLEHFVQPAYMMRRPQPTWGDQPTKEDMASVYVMQKVFVIVDELVAVPTSMFNTFEGN